MAGGEAWGAVGTIGAAAFSALGLVLAGIVAARAASSAARTTTVAQEAVREVRHEADCEALVRALARSYDVLRAWAAQPVGPPPDPVPRAQQYLDTGT